jgi:hypothetical protein
VCCTPSAHTEIGSILDFFVVGSQTASLNSGPSLDHNLCCRCPNGSCEAIFDIYTSSPFQQYKEHLKVRCFDFCDQALKLRESWRTPSSHFWECESHPHTCLKVGLRHRFAIVAKVLSSFFTNMRTMKTNNEKTNLNLI